MITSSVAHRASPWSAPPGGGQQQPLVPVRQSEERAARGHQVLWLAWLLDPNERVWLTRRPAPGVWGGLHALPVFDSEPALRAALPEIDSATMREQPLVRHLLTHKELELRPLLARLSASQANVPAGAFVMVGDENSTVRSARSRSATGWLKVTVTGIPTPTGAPLPGVMVATGSDSGNAATAAPTGPLSIITAEAATASA